MNTRIIKTFENKYIKEKNQHLIVFQHLNDPLYQLSNIRFQYDDNRLEIIYNDKRRVALNNIDIHSNDIMICEINQENVPVRIYLL